MAPGFLFDVLAKEFNNSRRMTNVSHAGDSLLGPDPNCCLMPLSPFKYCLLILNLDITFIWFSLVSPLPTPTCG